MSAPNVATNTRLADALQHPWIRALDVFSIPYLCYEGTYRAYTSRSADSLTRQTPLGAALVQQADRAVAHELGATPARAVRPLGPVLEVAGSIPGTVLAVHVARPSIGPIGAIVVIRAASDSVGADGLFEGLTPRERQVSQLIATGLSTKAIAFRLGMSEHTARHHTERVFSKLGVRSRAALASLVTRRGSDRS
jgi:DNA-binding CsgD family transcriptional regulator